MNDIYLFLERQSNKRLSYLQALFWLGRDREFRKEPVNNTNREQVISYLGCKRDFFEMILKGKNMIRRQPNSLSFKKLSDIPF